MRVAVAYSGGKDSTRAIYECIKAGDDVHCLLNVQPDTSESYLFHYPNARWTKLQAEALDLPLLSKEVKGGRLDEELHTFKALLDEAIEKYSIDCLYTGAVASVYQKRRFEQVASELGLKCVHPLWGLSGEQILWDLIQLGFKTIVVGVSAAGLGSEWLGRVIDAAAIEDLKKVNRRYGVNLSFEGGEAETFVLDAPIFRRSIKVTSSEVFWDGYVGFFLIRDAKLVDKRSVKEVEGEDVA
jgi:ABC transporter with metal-binding/Fe-S-binding domain ATP-binding protein